MIEKIVIDNLAIQYDFEAMTKTLAEMKEDFEPDTFVTTGYREIELAVENLKSIDLSKYIVDFQKKKNGTFNLTKKIALASCDNSEFDGSYCGKWTFYALEIRPLNDTNLAIRLVSTSYQENGF